MLYIYICIYIHTHTFQHVYYMLDCFVTPLILHLFVRWFETDTYEMSEAHIKTENKEWLETDTC